MIKTKIYLMMLLL